MGVIVGRIFHSPCLAALFVFASGLTLIGSVVVSRHLGSPSQADIAAGKTLFEHEFRVADPLCGDGDGLGPVFNAHSCVECHFLGGVGGAGSNSFNVTSFEVFPTPDRPLHLTGGIHRFATSENWLESVKHVESLYPTVQGATRVINGCVVVSGDFDPVQLEELNTPALFGAGLIDQLSSAAIAMRGANRTLAKISQNLDGDFSGIGLGRTQTFAGGSVGKFGWKGQFASLADFVATACAMELGLTNPVAAQQKPREYQADPLAELDMTNRQLRQLVAFVRELPPPEQVLPAEPEQRRLVEAGEQVFLSVGCAECHVPDLGGIEGIYSDFHLYEVESDSLDDSYLKPEFDPDHTVASDHPRPAEWKTPPLWGVADSAPYFHDGQSKTLEAAILRHDRDAKDSKLAYLQASPRDRLALLNFLGSLRGPQSLDSFFAALSLDEVE